jgi:streptogrisin C
MNKTIARLLIASAATASVVFAGSAPTGASTAIDTATPGAATSSVPTALTPGMVTAMERDLGITKDELPARIAAEFRATKVERALSRGLGTSYAGTWLAKDATAIVVATTDARQAARIRAAGAQPRIVANSEHSLDAAKARLDATRRPSPKAVAGWYVDPATNQVRVLARPGGTRAAKAFVAASGIPSGLVDLVTVPETPRTLYDVRGGDAYYMGGRCSVGFAVTGGFVSAGHCGTRGTPVSGYNQVAMGTFQGSSFPGNDYSWVSVNSNWTPRPWVNHYDGTNVTVSGSTEAAVGASICRSGSTTGWHCGSIQAKNQTVNYQEGSVSGLTRTNVCAEPGDSGGSWMSGSQAQGVTSGGSGDCTSGGTTYFQPVNEILSAYNLTLTTSGGGEPPPPTGCSSYPERFSGSLSGAGDYDQHPNGTYYQSGSGTHLGCLDGPSGVDFDLYLLKWNGSAWATVAASESSNPDETISYNGTSGYYTWVVESYSGSGSYTFGLDRP